MALDVNGCKTTFRAFVEFAQAKVEAGDKDSVARNGGSKVSAASADKAYALVRSADQKSANDVTRTIFREAVAGIFGGEDRIPERVRDAMKLSDYGKGKPLTARRIMAIKQAVDSLAADVDAAAGEMSRAFKTKFPTYTNSFGEGAVRRLCETAAEAAMGDRDVLKLLCNAPTLGYVLVGGDGQMRPDAGIARKVAGLKANIDEFRAAAKGDKALVEAAVEAMALFEGKTLPAGAPTRMVEAVKAVKVGAFKSLNGASSMLDIHGVVLQFSGAAGRVAADVIAAMGDDEAGENERIAARNMTLALLVARGGAGRLGAIGKALSSENAKRMRSIWNYMHDARERQNIVEDMKNPDRYEKLQECVFFQWQTLELMRKFVADSLGEGEFAPLPQFGGDIFEDPTINKGFPRVFHDLETAVG